MLIGKNNKLYNIVFPVFLLYIVPISWVYILPINFLVDSIVMLISMKVLNVEEKAVSYKKSILKVWGIGFASDLIGAIFLGGSYFLVESYRPLAKYADMAIVDPFESIVSFLIVAVCVFISGLCIYYLNKKFSFKKTRLDENEIHKMSLWLAIFTAPYTFFIPLRFIYEFLDMIA